MLKLEVFPTSKFLAGTSVSPKAEWFPEAKFFAVVKLLVWKEDLNPADTFVPAESLVGTEAIAAARRCSIVECSVEAADRSEAGTLTFLSFFSLSFSSAAALAFKEVSVCDLDHKIILDVLQYS